VPHVRDFIANNPYSWLERLVETYKIIATTAGDLVSLKYDQIESPMHEPIVQECRGMVVHVPTGQILAHPYNKFWNLGDPQAAPIDWSTARVQDKLDGSLMILYWNPFAGQWQVASSGQPVAGGSYGGDNSRTFGDAFWEIFHAEDMVRPADQHRHFCYMFELISPENRIVCKYEFPHLIVHGARNLKTESEMDPDLLAGLATIYGWTLVDAYLVANEHAALTQAAALDPTKHEGFVVVDANFNRVKIKSPRYVALHHLRGSGSTNTRRVIDLWKSGEIGELLTHFPEMAADVQPVLDKLDGLAGAAWNDVQWGAITVPTRKDFALRVKDHPWAPVAFRLFGDLATHPATRVQALTVMRAMPTPTLERMVESYSR
jgi:hypothetical protein